jgi:hypothetical protein
MRNVQADRVLGASRATFGPSGRRAVFRLRDGTVVVVAENRQA